MSYAMLTVRSKRPARSGRRKAVKTEDGLRRGEFGRKPLGREAEGERDREARLKSRSTGNSISRKVLGRVAEDRKVALWALGFVWSVVGRGLEWRLFSR